MEKDLDCVHRDLEQMKRDIAAIKSMLEVRRAMPLVALAEKSLVKGWLSKEEDEAWKDL